MHTRFMFFIYLGLSHTRELSSILLLTLQLCVPPEVTPSQRERPHRKSQKKWSGDLSALLQPTGSQLTFPSRYS